MTCAWFTPAPREVFNGRVAAVCVLAVWMCAAATGCARDTVDPVAVAAFRPAHAAQASAALCPAAPDILVSTEAELRNAVAIAAPGATIAISGMITLSHGAITIERSDLRLTCATPGAGLQGHPTYLTPRLLEIRAPRVSVTGLRLDGQQVTLETVWVESPPLGTPSEVGEAAADVTLADNDVTCGPNSCAGFLGTPRAVIARNRMAPAVGGITETTVSFVSVVGLPVAEGVTLADNMLTCGSAACAYFWGTPRAVIARNQMAPAVGVGLANVVDVFASGELGEPTADDVILEDNDLTCGSGVCVFFAETPRAVITRNRMTAASSVSGIHVQSVLGGVDGTRIEQNTVTTSAPSTNPKFGGIRVARGKGVVVNDNVVTGPWANGIAVGGLLGGEIARNDLRGAYQYGIALAVSNTSRQIGVDGLSVRNNKITDAAYAGIGVKNTCRSVFVGNNLNGNVRGAEFFLETGANTLHGNGTIVFDNGAWDCDGDGIPDPNVISGAKGVHKGPPLGPVIGDAANGAGGAMR